MSASSEAKAHLRKAREFLDIAELSNSMDAYDAAASNAVTSGINSKDAICLKLTGATGKSENHSAATKELSKAGPAGAEVSATFSRLLGIKTPSQYTTKPTSAKQAADAVTWAARMYEQAVTVVG